MVQQNQYPALCPPPLRAHTQHYSCTIVFPRRVRIRDAIKTRARPETTVSRCHHGAPCGGRSPQIGSPIAVAGHRWVPVSQPKARTSRIDPILLFFFLTLWMTWTTAHVMDYVRRRQSLSPLCLGYAGRGPSMLRRENNRRRCDGYSFVRRYVFHAWACDQEACLYVPGHQNRFGRTHFISAQRPSFQLNILYPISA